MSTEQAQQTTSLEQQTSELQSQLSGMMPQQVLDTFKGESSSLGRSDFTGRALKVGDIAPDFSLPSATGKTINLASLLTQGPVIVTFYRGEWCPYCNLQLKAYQAVLPEIRRLGATLVAVSPQTPDHSLSTAEKKGLEFEVLSDAHNTVARQYGLVFSVEESIRPTYLQVGSDLKKFNGEESWELPSPGTFVIAPDRSVLLSFVDGDYTRRLEPQAILDVLSVKPR